MYSVQPVFARGVWDSPGVSLERVDIPLCIHELSLDSRLAVEKQVQTKTLKHSFELAGPVYASLLFIKGGAGTNANKNGALPGAAVDDWVRSAPIHIMIDQIYPARPDRSHSRSNSLRIRQVSFRIYCIGITCDVARRLRTCVGTNQANFPLPFADALGQFVPRVLGRGQLS